MEKKNNHEDSSIEQLAKKVIRVISIYPTNTGFAFAVFEGERNPIDWGNIKTFVKRGKVKDLVRKVRVLLDYYKPDVLISEDIEKRTNRSETAMQLSKVLPSLAVQQNLSSRQYTQEAVHGVFDSFRAQTRHEIAELIGSWLPNTLRAFVPAKRKEWEVRNSRMALFDAISYLLTYYYIHS